MGGGATVYNPRDIPYKEGLIETLREKAEKQGSSFIHLRLDESVYQKFENNAGRDMAVYYELRHLRHESEKIRTSEEKKMNPYYTVYIDPMDDSAKRYINDMGNSPSDPCEPSWN